MKKRQPKAVVIQPIASSTTFWLSVPKNAGFEVIGTDSLDEGKRLVSIEQPDLVFFVFLGLLTIENEWSFVKCLLQCFSGEVFLIGLFNGLDSVTAERVHTFPLPVDMDEIEPTIQNIFHKIKKQ